MLYFSVPCSSVEKCVFNANRLFNPYTIIRTFDKMNLIDFYIVKKNTIIQYDIRDMTEEFILNQLENTKIGNTCIFIFMKVQTQ